MQFGSFIRKELNHCPILPYTSINLPILIYSCYQLSIAIRDSQTMLFKLVLPNVTDMIALWTLSQAWYSNMTHSKRHLNYLTCSFRNCPPNCPTCREPLDTPAKLPCGHMLCAMCARQNEKCPADECDQNIPEKYEYKPEDDDSLEWVFVRDMSLVHVILNSNSNEKNHWHHS